MKKTKLPAKINEIIKQSNIEDMSKAEAIASNYAPFMGQVNDQIKALKKLKEGDPEDAEKAKRIRIDCGKICARSKDQKKVDKDHLLIQTRFIDALHNTVEGAARITQGEAEDIEKHFENIEKERIEKLDETRRLILEQYDVNMPVGSLGVMSDQVWIAFKDGNKAQHEAKERERIEAEEREEAERIEAERIEKLYNERIIDLYNKGLTKYCDPNHELTMGELSNEEYQQLVKDASAAKKVHDDEQDRIQKENERLKKEAEEREKQAKIEADKRAEAEDDRKEKEEILNKAGKARQEMLFEIDVNLDFESCKGMEESLWSEFYREKNDAYQQEQSRLALEKRKEEKERKEREEISELNTSRWGIIRDKGLITYVREKELGTLTESEFDKLLADNIRAQKEQFEYEAEERRRANIALEKERKIEADKWEKEEQERIKKELKEEAEAERLAKIETDLKKGDIMKVRDLVIDLQDLKTKYEFKSKRNKKMHAGVCEMVDKMVKYIGNK